MIRSVIPHLRDLWLPPSTEPAWRWIRDNVGLGQDSELKRFDFDLCPMHRFFHDSVQNPATRRVTEMVCAQSGKTKNALAQIIWRVRNNPRDAAWFTDTSEKAKSFFKVMLQPFMRDCDAVSVQFPKDKAKRSMRLVQFDSMNLHILGAESRTNRESITLFSVWCDEVRNYKPGALTQIDNRLKTIRNSQRIIFSSAGEEHDELHRAFNEGTRHMFFWTCPHCGHKQTFRFGRDASSLYPQPRDHGGFVWDSNELTHPDDSTWNFPELIKTVRYQCENAACKYLFHPNERPLLMRTLEPIQTNPHADQSNISMHWWEAYMPWADCEWGSIVVKFLRASLAAKRGNFGPLKSIVCETFGEPWSPSGGLKVSSGDVLKRCGDYAMGETYTEPGAIKTLLIDMQGGYVYYVRRDILPGKGSRLVDCGTMPGLEDVRSYQLAKGIQDAAVLIDSAYETTKVLQACAEHGRYIPNPNAKTLRDLKWDGWTPMLGTDYKEFSEVDPEAGSRVKRPFRYVDININEGRSGQPRYVRRYEISKPHYNEIVFIHAMRGQIQGWEIPKNIPPEYVKQMGHVWRHENLDAEGQVIGYEWRDKQRHDYPDCEKFAQAVYDMAGLVR